MWKLQGNRAAGFECGFQAGGEIVDAWRMGVNIVADDEVGLSSLTPELVGQRLAEEFAKNRNTDFFGCIGRTGGRFDAEAGDASGDEVPQKLTIVGGNLDDEAIRVKSKTFRDFFRIPGGVIEPAPRYG